ncbi:MAG: twin-arginine translocase TatA/TatE family subunit [Flavobacteriales bacterium]|nr:twin-arginine translocase TatA/TatE family subunit [Flavobacteriales bacterium]
MPGGGELFFIVLIIIMLFGSKKIPELARGLGKGLREIKNATGDIQREIREGAKDINSVKDSVDVEKQVKDLIKKETEPKETESVEEESAKEETKEESTPKPETIQRRSPYTSEDSQNSTENL